MNTTSTTKSRICPSKGSETAAPAPTCPSLRQAGAPHWHAQPKVLCVMGTWQRHRQLAERIVGVLRQQISRLLLISRHLSVVGRRVQLCGARSGRSKSVRWARHFDKIRSRTSSRSHKRGRPYICRAYIVSTPQGLCHCQLRSCYLATDVQEAASGKTGT